eukprot:CAMPEP_0178443972 /NCGR_PEP_ID=MMETSP0689_2-20121128/39221_1 /TAXON_ID=160604 /ORGANISM="Amphidinium massartii, Strain CS-259" /LENGTH=231 /DNA_ID=CAMNT_0020068097 /DNA_START=63 /DNA_END=758 /DNA_ORIENTATION=-
MAKETRSQGGGSNMISVQKAFLGAVEDDEGSRPNVRAKEASAFRPAQSKQAHHYEAEKSFDHGAATRQPSVNRGIMEATGREVKEKRQKKHEDEDVAAHPGAEAESTKEAEVTVQGTLELIPLREAVRNKWDDTTPVTTAEKPPSRPPNLVAASSNHRVLRLQAMQIRALLGKGGETVNEIRRRSGADIKIHHPPHEAEGSVSIVGNAMAAEMMIQEALLLKGCRPTSMCT